MFPSTRNQCERGIYNVLRLYWKLFIHPKYILDTYKGSSIGAEKLLTIVVRVTPGCLTL